MALNVAELNKAVARELGASELKQTGGQVSAAMRERFATCAASVPGTLRRAVDVYNGPQGKGFVLRMIYEEGGKRWIRTVFRGPLAGRSTDWKPLIVPQQTT